MNRLEAIREIRLSLASGQASVGSWMQLADASVAEIMGRAGYDWVAIDMEHGAIAHHQLPNIFRALELGSTLPLVRLAEGTAKECKQALDAGAGGVIVPMIETAAQLIRLRDNCRWPPTGTRGVGFSRANHFGEAFDNYAIEAQEPLLIAMFEHIRTLEELDLILQVRGLDAIFIGPYDLSASMGLTGQFEAVEYGRAVETIRLRCREHGVACGLHVVTPDISILQQRLSEGYLLIAYSIDAVFMNSACKNPKQV